MKAVILRVCSLILLALCCGLAQAQEAGLVMTVKAGASVQREGKTLTLKVKDAIRQGDILSTDATGRVRVLFDDDSSITLGSNTVFTVESYAAAGGKPGFSGRLAKGLCRVITGKIVEKNPDGFRLSTPEATIGIRGTILTVRSGDSTTTAYVENTLRQVYVNGINVPSLSKITIAPDAPSRIEPIAPQDRREIGRDLAFLGGAGSAAAAPQPDHIDATYDLSAYALLPEGPALDDLPLARAPQTAAPTSPVTPPVSPVTPPTPPVTPPAPPVTPPVLPVMAVVSGTLSSSSMSDFVGNSFSFTVDLPSGKITDGKLSGYLTLYLAGGIYIPLTFVVNLIEGRGSADSTGFSVTNFNNASDPPILSMVDSNSSVLRGGTDLSTISNGGNVDAVWSIPITNPGGSLLVTGIAAGTLTK